jgi:hypothetical protein
VIRRPGIGLSSTIGKDTLTKNQKPATVLAVKRSTDVTHLRALGERRSSGREDEGERW